MNTKKTHIVVVLDRSGSMGSIARPTVEGFNTFLNEQKNAEGEAYITLVQFDDRYEENYRFLPVAQANELVLGENFSPRGSTALLDAIGKTIEDLHEELKGEDVVFVIITDGEENASRTYTREAAMRMIETKEKEDGWSFLFLAANQDAIRAGGSIGVKGANAMTFDASTDGVTNMYMSFSANIASYRSAKSGMTGSVGENGISGTAAAAVKDILSFSKEQREKTKADESDNSGQ